MAPHRITGVKSLYDGWSKLLKLTIATPDGRSMEREVEDHGAAVAVLPYDPERRTVVLVSQLRVPVMHVEGRSDMVETIAGMLDGGEPAEVARREAMEEAGLRLETLEPVGRAWSAPGITTERVSLFLARYSAADRVAEGGGLAEEHEEIEVLEIGIDELAGMLERRGIDDMKTLILAQALQLRHPELFATA
jgi:nudix-type nucleoside diphosphatase (YffH/AdpP family)